MNKLFSKENKIIITHHTSDAGDEAGPHMACEVAEGKAPGAKGGGEQLRGVHE